jgi:hypothetical protein
VRIEKRSSEGHYPPIPRDSLVAHTVCTRQVPQFRIKFHIFLNVGNGSNHAISVSITETTSDNVLLCDIKSPPKITPKVLFSPNLGNLFDNIIRRILETDLSSVSKEVLLCARGEVYFLPSVDLIRHFGSVKDKLPRSVHNLLRLKADVSDVDLAKVALRDHHAVRADHTEDASHEIVAPQTIVGIHKKHLRERVPNTKRLHIEVFMAKSNNVLGMVLTPCPSIYLLGFPSSPTFILKDLKDVGSGKERVSARHSTLFGGLCKSSGGVSTQ